MADLKNEVIELANSMGIDKIGFTSKDILRDSPPSADLDYVLTGANSAISLCLAFDPVAIYAYLAKQDMWAHNADHKSVYFKLKLVGQRIQKLIEERGYQAVVPLLNDQYRAGQDYLAMVPPLSAKYVALAAGIGWLGWNNLVLTPEFGARMALATVVTTAELKPDSPSEPEDWCGKCRLCVASCPVDFIAKDSELKVTVAGREYVRAETRSRMRCLVCCGGATGVNNPSDKWSTWCPTVLDLPGPEDDDAWEKAVLEYAKDPRHMRLKWLLKFFEGPGASTWEEFDYSYLIEEWFTCGYCMLICSPTMKARRENWRRLRASGRATSNPTYARVSVL